MTKTETVEVMRSHLWNKQNGKCRVCRKAVECDRFHSEIAHRLPQRKWCIAKWGPEVIHHEDNLALVCKGTDCNAKVQMNPETLGAFQFAEKIADKIKKAKGVS